MSKELSPLEALDLLPKKYGANMWNCEEYQIVKTALKDYEELKFVEVVNERLRDEIYKRDEILQIIKEKKVDIVFLIDCEWDLNTYNKHFLTYKNHCPYKLTQQEFDLLRGWLK